MTISELIGVFIFLSLLGILPCFYHKLRRCEASPYDFSDLILQVITIFLWICFCLIEIHACCLSLKII